MPIEFLGVMLELGLRRPRCARRRCRRSTPRSKGATRGCRCSTRSCCSGRERTLGAPASGSGAAHGVNPRDCGWWSAPSPSSPQCCIGYYVITVVPGVARRASRRRPASRRRSSCSAPRSTTAAVAGVPGSARPRRRPLQARESRRWSSSRAERFRVTNSPKPARAPTTCTRAASPTKRSCARPRAGTRGSRCAASARFLKDRGIKRRGARLGSVPLVADQAHRRGARIRRGDVADADEPDQRLRGVAADLRRGTARRGGPNLRLRSTRPGDSRGDAMGEVGGSRIGLTILTRTFGGGVIGNTTGSGPVIGGSSPPPRARRLIVDGPAPGPVV